jgi:hypothetical protein
LWVVEELTFLINVCAATEKYVNSIQYFQDKISTKYDII